jgi:uncharacterized protein YecT (DUF1311 family)
LEACLKEASEKGQKPEQCIGAVEGPCLEEPGGESTIGMKNCAGREIDAWDERLNATYRKVMAGPLAQIRTQRMDGAGSRSVTGAEIIRDAQRAWLAARVKKCTAAGLPMEGGTGEGLLYLRCFLRETAQQTLWLEDLRTE